MKLFAYKILFLNLCFVFSNYFSILYDSWYGMFSLLPKTSIKMLKQSLNLQKLIFFISFYA